jgi:hypothetical protein
MARSLGSPITDKYLAWKRGADDYPSYERLRAKGKTNADILRSATRSTNPRADQLAQRLRVAGRALLAADVALSVGQVAAAPEKERAEEATKHAGRVAGAVGGAKFGATVGGAVGAWFGGVGAPIGAAAGGIIGGIVGGIAGENFGEELGRELFG